MTNTMQWTACPQNLIRLAHGRATEMVRLLKTEGLDPTPDVLYRLMISMYIQGFGDASGAHSFEELEQVAADLIAEGGEVDSDRIH